MTPTIYAAVTLLLIFLGSAVVGTADAEPHEKAAVIVGVAILSLVWIVVLPLMAVAGLGWLAGSLFRRKS